MFQMWIVAIVIGVCCAYDIKYKAIPAVWCLAMGGIGLLYVMRDISTNGENLLYAVLLCGIFLLISKITHEGIGIGDGMVAGFLCMTAGLRNTIIILCIALTLSFLFSVGILCLRKGNRHTTFPFIPFLYTGFWLSAVMSYIK